MQLILEKKTLKSQSGQSIKAVAYLNLSITQGFRNMMINLITIKIPIGLFTLQEHFKTRMVIS
jgi:hypothetical protein